MHKQQYCKLENTVKQSWFKHLWQLHKEWTEARVSASRVTTLRRLQEKGYQATSETETLSETSYLGCGEKELSGPKSSFRMKVNFAFHLETRSQSLEEEWRGTDSMLLEVQCEVPTVSDDLGCHVICWCWSTVFSEVHSQRSHLPGNFRALHASHQTQQCRWAEGHCQRNLGFHTTSAVPQTDHLHATPNWGSN